MPLRKHAVCSGVAARGLFGERKKEGKNERAKGLVGVGTWVRQADRAETRGRTEAREVRERAVPGGHF